MEPASVAEPSAAAPPAGGGCPFPHAAMSGAAAGETSAAAAFCPVQPGTAPVQRSAADVFVRRLLRVNERPAGLSDAKAYSTFQRSMAISAVRCTLTYVVFPFVMPAVGFATGVGPLLGLVIGTIAIVCDVYTIRRFFAVDHKWRWHFSTIAFGIICLLAVLLVQDVRHLLT